MSQRNRYSVITDDELKRKVQKLHEEFPNSGVKVSICCLMIWVIRYVMWCVIWWCCLSVTLVFLYYCKILQLTIETEHWHWFVVYLFMYQSCIFTNLLQLCIKNDNIDAFIFWSYRGSLLCICFPCAEAQGTGILTNSVCGCSLLSQMFTSSHPMICNCFQFYLPRSDGRLVKPCCHSRNRTQVSRLEK